MQILNFAKSEFARLSLPEPMSFRAGGWFANLETLKAIDEAGFLIDSSGRTPYTFGTNRVAGHWNLKTTTPPYHPSTTDQNSSSPAPNLSLLEVPNNGADTFAFTSTQLIDRFKDNYQGGPLSEPRQVTYLSHPHWFKHSRQQAIDQTLDYINQWSFKDDKGPVIYSNLSELYPFFAKP